ncbi:MAG TPA: ABC transporter substrate-binding protein, partial [Kribbella sp.]|nr:ABC transporter substrate-binding protein [Kribbella sp.]
KQGSAYDLYLTRTLQHATIVRGTDGVDVFRAEGLEVAAGIRQPITQYVDAHHDLRLIDERFMQIQQAVGTVKTKQPATVAYLHALVEDLKSSGSITTSLANAGQSTALVAPPA